MLPMFRAFGLGVLIGLSHAGWILQEAEVLPYSANRSSWLLHDKVPAEHPVEFTVALKVDEDRHSALEKVFWEVSDPKHPKYGQHLSLDGITQLLAVPDSRVGLVKDYFEQAGATTVVGPNKDVITVSMPAAAAEAALNTSLSFFKRPEGSDRRIVRASTHYWLPEHVAREVVMVGELLQFPHLSTAPLQKPVKGSGNWPNSCDDPGCSGLVTPAVLAQRYKLPSKSDAVAKNSMAVAEFQGQYYKDSDLSSFGNSCQRDVKVDKTIGGDKPVPGVEAELDIEYIKAVAPEIHLTVVYDNQFSLLSWVNQITSLQDSPLVHSVSYGNDEKQQISAQYIYTCNTAFMKAGARGLSILFASGDQGVCGRQGCGKRKHAPFHPDFPGDSPYITTVGGTDFKGSDIGEETAWSASGGGFSNYFSIPEYQKAAVAAYKASPDANLPPQRLWNNTGRGYPDVAALGGTKTPYCVAVQGEFAGVAGTSAACPVVAGVFAKLNGLRLKARKPPLGFLNPFIYQNPSAFQDVTSGKNSATRKWGFTAVKGWDPATGFGTPDYEALAKASMSIVSDDQTVVV
ncbi:unnamed protein product [Polarella glacialis]|uniref:subtilisin n=1 Tax=Polarella glacialis TaxID=89957 RepID=A0A813KN62_POLGL|nr:unnamed protein product [Polarella glacialis]